MKKTLYIILAQTIFVNFAFTQKPKFDFGVQCGINVDILCDKQNFFKFYFNAGIGLMYTQNLYNRSDIRPSFYLNYRNTIRGFGAMEKNKYADSLKNCKNHFAQFVSISLLAQFGSDNEASISSSRISGKPQYYFSKYYNPIFLNPYKVSVGLGSTLIHKIGKKSYSQRVGTFDFSCYNVSLNFINDGAFPFSLFGKSLADLHDRWHTGGLVISAYFKKDSSMISHNVEFSYTKYTGFSKNSYEISNELFLTEVSYKDSLEQLYNLGAYSLNYNFLLNSNRIGFGIMVYQPFNRDLQHWLHQKQYFSKHISAGKRKWGVPFSYGYKQSTL